MPVILNEGQRTALSELAAAGFGRAAGSLSTLTGQAIVVHAALLKFAALPEAVAQLGDGLPGQVICVNQPFTGPISGNGLLLMDPMGATRLTTILGIEPDQQGKNIALAETLTEVGNILLNACLGVFDNLLSVPITFAVPVFSTETVEHVLRRVSVADGAGAQAFLVRARMELSECSVWGQLVIMPRPASLDLLIRKLAIWDAGRKPEGSAYR